MKTLTWTLFQHPSFWIYIFRECFVVNIISNILSYFEDVSCEVLTEFDYYNDDEECRDLLLQNVPYFENLNCLEIADSFGSLKFFSTPTVQILFKNIWNGNLKRNKGFFTFLEVEYNFRLIIK